MRSPRWTAASGMAAAAFFSLSAAASVFFPIGLYDVDSPEALDSLSRLGFNAVYSGRVQPSAAPAWSEAARRTGMRLMLPPDRFLASDSPAPKLPVAAWILVDEPDVWQWKPEDLAALDAKVRRWSPETPTAFVLGDARSAKTYAGSGQILMVDWYPVPHLPLSTVGDEVAWTAEAAAGRPVWAVLQAMDWRDYPQRDAAKPRVGRFPDFSEIRFMTYDALIHGASGIWYFTYRRPDGTLLPQRPGEWWAVTSVVRELAALRPILENGERLGTPEALNLGMIGLKLRSRRRLYYFLANETDQYVYLPEYYRQFRFDPLFEPHRSVGDDLVEENGAYWLPPWRVLVLETSEAP